MISARLQREQKKIVCYVHCKLTAVFKNNSWYRQELHDMANIAFL
jgi:hypothetical protein